MLNYLWAFMILIGVIYGTVSGNMNTVSEGIFEAAGEAVSLCITMLGVMGLWSGLMRIAEESGLILKWTKSIRPFVRWMFPRIPKGHPAQIHISTNIIANMLGLGWAATPSGLKAMEELAKRKEPGRGSGIASNEMCDFLILNISSLQLVPVSIIAYRTQYGSLSPTSIIGPAMLATTISTITGIVFCKCMNWRSIK